MSLLILWFIWFVLKYWYLIFYLLVIDYFYGLFLIVFGVFVVFFGVVLERIFFFAKEFVIICFVVRLCKSSF